MRSGQEGLCKEMWAKTDLCKGIWSKSIWSKSIRAKITRCIQPANRSELIKAADSIDCARSVRYFLLRLVRMRRHQQADAVLSEQFLQLISFLQTLA